MNRYSDMTIWALREEMTALQAELATRDVTSRPTPPALPDEAGEMVKRMRKVADDCAFQELTDLLEEAASLIERLVPRWISVNSRPPTVEDGIFSISDADGQLGYGYVCENKKLIVASEGTGPAIEWCPLPPQKGST